MSVYYVVVSETIRVSYPKYSSAKKVYDCLDEVKAIYRVEKVSDEFLFVEDNHIITFIEGTDIFQ